MTREQLFGIMISRIYISLHDANGILRHGYINRIALEDGSGYNFIITLSSFDKKKMTTNNYEIFYRSNKK